MAALLEHLGIDRAHMLGIAGIGSCLGQELAIGCPERVRSLAMSGTWARADAYFRALLTAPRLSVPVEEGIRGARAWMMRDSAHVITDRRSRKEFADLLLDFLAAH